RELGERDEVLRDPRGHGAAARAGERLEARERLVEVVDAPLRLDDAREDDAPLAERTAGGAGDGRVPGRADGVAREAAVLDVEVDGPAVVHREEEVPER